jgi:hypothetical protein
MLLMLPLQLLVLLVAPAGGTAIPLTLLRLLLAARRWFCRSCQGLSRWGGRGCH